MNDTPHNKYCERCGITLGPFDLCYCDYRENDNLPKEIPIEPEIIIEPATPLIKEVVKPTRNTPEYYESGGDFEPFIQDI